MKLEERETLFCLSTENCFRDRYITIRNLPSVATIILDSCPLLVNLLLAKAKYVFANERITTERSRDSVFKNFSSPLDDKTDSAS